MMSTVFLISLILRLILTVHSHNSPLDEREIRRKISLRTPPLPPGDCSTLHVQPDGSSFKIVLFADLHFGEDAWTDWGPRQDVNSTKVMSTVLDEEHPGGKGCSFKGTTRFELMTNELEMNKLSYSKFGPEDLWPSVSNYVLKLSSTDDPETVIAYMYFLDSGGGSYPEVISNAQAEWFNRTSQEINPNSRVPEIIFWHIPSQAYKKVAPRFYAHRNCIGSMFMEKVASQEAEMGMMKLLEGRSSVKVITMD